MLELMPFWKQSVLFKNCLEHDLIHSFLFDELQDSYVVFCSSGRQCDRCEVFWKHHPRPDTLHVHGYGGNYGLLFQFITRDKKLDRPITQDNVLSILNSAMRLQVLVNWSKANQHATTWRREQNEYIHVQSSGRFQVKGCTNSSAYGVMRDDAISLHLVN